MKLAFSSILLGFSWFAAVNLGATVIAWAIARAIGGFRCGAGVLLGVRLMPALVSSFFVAAMFLPAHWRFERADSDETFGVVLGALALLGLALVGRSLLRAYSLLRTDLQLDARLTALTRQLGTPRGIAFEVTGLAGVSLAGILRPKILVGSRALAALTPAELEVAISHEVAHQRSLDNLKRFLICCAPDVFGWLPAARRLEAALGSGNGMPGRCPCGARRRQPGGHARLGARQGGAAGAPGRDRSVAGVERVPRADAARDPRPPTRRRLPSGAADAGAALVHARRRRRRAARGRLDAQSLLHAARRHRGDGDAPALIAPGSDD